MSFRDQTHVQPVVVEEAQATVCAAIVPLDVERVHLRDALGRVLRQDVHAPFDVPERDNTAMDGYAVVAADTATATKETPVVLPVIEDIGAGVIAVKSVERGTVSRIMTGALMPHGADAVVQVEWTDAGDSSVRIFRPVRAGANVRRRGEDMRAGDVVLRSGTRIGSGEIGVLAAAQQLDVAVTRKPRVAILSTGDELVAIDESRGEGKVVNSNAWSLAALVEEHGGDAVMHDIVRDDRDVTIAALRSALSSDIVISTGGVSAGAYDYVREAIEAIGADVRFAKVAMKPGKPVVFATSGERLIFGLPGNPVSCMVAFHLFIAPAMRKLAAIEGDPLPPVVRARLADPIRAKGDRRTYIRVRVRAIDGKLEASARPAQGSGVTTSMIGANGLAYLEEGQTAAAAGEKVPVVLIGPIAR